MKKIAIIALMALTVATTSAEAFSLSKAVGGKDKIKMNKCLMEEAQEKLAKGEVNKDNVETVAEEIAISCAAKVATKNDKAGNIKMAIKVLKTILE